MGEVPVCMSKRDRAVKRVREEDAGGLMDA